MKHLRTEHKILKTILMGLCSIGRSLIACRLLYGYSANYKGIPKTKKSNSNLCNLSSTEMEKGTVTC